MYDAYKISKSFRGNLINPKYSVNKGTLGYTKVPLKDQLLGYTNKVLDPAQPQKEERRRRRTACQDSANRGALRYIKDHPLDKGDVLGYTNTVPLQDKQHRVRLVQFNNIIHKTINFVDDSTAIISFKDHSYMKTYLEAYFSLIYEFYSINRLKINSDKTCLLIINKPKLDQTLANFHFKASQYTIKRKKKNQDPCLLYFG